MYSGGEITSSINKFVKRHFDGCVFEFWHSGMTNEMVITFKKADFNPFNSSVFEPDDMVTTPIRLTNRRMQIGNLIIDPFAHNLDLNRLSTARRKGERSWSLSEECVIVMQKIVKFIKENFDSRDNLLDSYTYHFYISEGFEIVDSKVGKISKPTKIDHKTFKGRKRRSVAEMIIERSL